MLHSWWNLPGPSRFVTEIVNDFRDGRNVVILMPDFAPEGFEEAIRSDFDNFLIWNNIEVDSNAGLDPTHFLYSKFCLSKCFDQSEILHILLEADSFVGQLIWLKGINSDNLGAWKTFISTYQHFCRNVPLIQRTVFGIALNGNLCIAPPRDDVCVVSRKWDGYVDDLDMLLYCSQLLRNRTFSKLEKQLAVNVIAKLASFDPHVCLALAEKTLEQIVNPTPILRQIGECRGWHNISLDKSATHWHSGMKQTVSDEIKIHPAVLAFKDPDEEIKRRVWTAQISVLFPYIEEQRRKLLESYKKHFRIPYTTINGETIENLWQLEISHILSQFAEGLPVEPKEVIFTDKLRKMRNQMAHLDLVDLDLVPGLRTAKI
jgi:hypothetical protein